MSSTTASSLWAVMRYSHHRHLHADCGGPVERHHPRWLPPRDGGRQNLDGGLSVSLGAGYAPRKGDSFTVVEGGAVGVGGYFSSVSLLWCGFIAGLALPEHPLYFVVTCSCGHGGAGVRAMTLPQRPSPSSRPLYGSTDTARAATLTATVTTGDGGTPTGTVLFEEGDTILGSATVDSTGTTATYLRPSRDHLGLCHQ